MSEFVECQNCGRTFFAENIECPYCRGGAEEEEQDAGDGERLDLPPRDPSSGGMFRLILGALELVLGGVAILALLSLRSAPTSAGRWLLGLECAGALVTLGGLAARRRWGRLAAVLFILANAGMGIAAGLRRGEIDLLPWGSGPAAMLLFLLPLFSPQARERYSR